MTPEEIKKVLDEKYRFRPISAGLIIDIVVDAAEMMKREDLRPRITERKTLEIPDKHELSYTNEMFEFLEKCRTCGAYPQVIDGSLNTFWCTAGKMWFKQGSAYVLGSLECHEYSEKP